MACSLVTFQRKHLKCGRIADFTKWMLGSWGMSALTANLTQTVILILIQVYFPKRMYSFTKIPHTTLYFQWRWLIKNKQTEAAKPAHVIILTDRISQFKVKKRPLFLRQLFWASWIEGAGVGKASFQSDSHLSTLQMMQSKQYPPQHLMRVLTSSCDLSFQSLNDRIWTLFSHSFRAECFCVFDQRRCCYSQVSVF